MINSRQAIIISYVDKISYENTLSKRMIEEGDWFQASCPMLSLGATGSSPEEALDNLLEQIEEIQS